MNIANNNKQGIIIQQKPISVKKTIEINTINMVKKRISNKIKKVIVTLLKESDAYKNKGEKIIKINMSIAKIINPDSALIKNKNIIIVMIKVQSKAATTIVNLL